MKINSINKLDVLANFVIVFIVISLILLSVVSLYGSIQVFAANEDVYYNGDISSNYVSLMFNVYWGDEYLDGILDILKDHNVTTTFFVGGSWADDNMEYLKKIVSLGHEIGNHGYFHKNQSRLSFEDNVEEIKSNNIVVKNLCGVDMVLFAPPSGDFSENTIEAAKSLNMKVIMWSLDTIDWRDKDDDIIYQRAIKAKGGDLVLMHPTQNTLNVLDKVLTFYEENNLKVVTVSRNINPLV